MMESRCVPSVGAKMLLLQSPVLHAITNVSIEVLVLATLCRCHGTRSILQGSSATSSQNDDRLLEAHLRANCGSEVEIYDDLLTRDNAKTPSADVYVAGFPCQPFSGCSHARKGFDDVRGGECFRAASII